MDCSEITTVEELRILSFSDLFYAIYNNRDGDHIASQIIATINPNYSQEVIESIDKFLDYKNLDNSYNQRICRQIETIRENLTDDLMTLFEKNNIDDVYLEYLNPVFEAKNKFIETNESYQDEISKFRLNTSRRVSRDRIEELREKSRERINEIGAKLDFRQQIWKEFEQEFLAEISACFGEDKVLKALYILPYIRTDQELLIFFGNNFQKTFSEVDAYVGLLYSSEYFDFEKSTFNLALEPLLEAPFKRAFLTAN